MARTKRQDGFTLIEVAAAIAICILLGSSVAALFQVFDINARGTIHVKLLNEIDSAAHWLIRDAQMAQSINTGSPAGLPLNLTWTEWNGTTNNVTYHVQNGTLRREYSKDGGQALTTAVARYVDGNPQMTSVQYSEGTLVFNITTVLTGYRSANETRSLKIFPRAAVE